MENLIENFEVFTNSNKSLLINGETGTGKSTLAKKVHLHSNRKDERFVRLNINSLNPNLFESELFGHVKGSFSGAARDKQGFCTLVGQGTLFIDEIGDLSLEMQTKLLTLIDERVFYKVGSCEEQKFMGRLIFATNKNLEILVNEGKFRRDLYFRLRYFVINLPNLREKNDLFQLILEQINHNKVRYNVNPIIKQEVLEILMSYHWPGNFRELANTIEYFFELGKQNITIFDVPGWLDNEGAIHGQLKGCMDYYRLHRDFEEKYFDKLLTTSEGSITKAVGLSGVSKVTIISKLKKYGINRTLYKKLNKTINAHGF